MKFLFFVLKLMIFSSVGRAENLGQFMQAVKDNSLLYQQTRNEAADRETETLIEKSQWLPQLSLEADYQDKVAPAQSLGFALPGQSQIETKNYTASLNLTQNVYSGGAIAAGVGLKKIAYELKSHESQVVLQKALQSNLLQLIRFKHVGRNIEVLRESLKVQNRFLNLVRRRKRKGLARNFEFHQAKADQMAFTLRVKQLEQEKQVIADGLLSRTGLAADKLQRIQLPKVESLVVKKEAQFSPQKNPDYSLLQFQQDLVLQGLRLDRTRHRPKFVVGLSLGRQASEFKDLLDRENEVKAYFASLQIPLFSGFADRRRKRLSLSKKVTLERQKEQVKRDIQVNKDSIQTRLAENKALIIDNRAWVGSARRALNGVMADYRLGRVENIQVVQMQALYERAQMSELSLIELYYADYVNLNYLLGRDLQTLF